MTFQRSKFEHKLSCCTINENAFKYRASVIKIFVDLAYGFEVEEMNLETILELMEFLCSNDKCKESDFERMILCLCCHALLDSNIQVYRFGCIYFTGRM